MAAVKNIIPLTTAPNQTFRITVEVDGENLSLQLGLRYNLQARYWVMSVTDGKTGKMLVDGIPILTGVYPAANLLEQYNYLKIGSAVIVPVGPVTEKPEPDDETLGSSFVLVWGDTIG